MFETLLQAPPDPILGLTEAFHADTHPDKVNLGVGVYQDENGRTPVLASIRAAETAVVGAQTTKAYLPITGTPEFAARVDELIFSGHPALKDGRVATSYAPGGTGALRLGAEFLRMVHTGGAAWVSSPTWPNHKGIFAAAGYAVKEYPYYAAARHGADFDRMLHALQQVPAGDLVVLHVCCHNPTGADLTADQWTALAAVAAKQGWIPVLDTAYIGFGDGLEADRAPLAAWLDAGVDALVASSFSKNMGLYRERAGALSLLAGTAAAARTATGHLKRAIRVIYSNAVGHACQTVTRVLSDAILRDMWHRELNEMRARIHSMREALAAGLTERGAGDFSFITHQRGMFSFSGLTPKQVEFLRTQKHIFMTGDGRINVAGLTPANLKYVCDGIAAAMREA